MTAYKERKSNLEVEKLDLLGHEIVSIMNTINLVNDLINHFPDVEEIKHKADIKYYYHGVQKSLVNVFSVNNDVSKRLNDVAVKLYELGEKIDESTKD